MCLLPNSEIKSEIHDITRQCLTRHKFKKWGDALDWLHKEEYEILEQEAGSLGISKLSTEILWLIGLFGPTEEVDWDVVNIRVPPLAKISTKEEPEKEPLVSPPKVIKRARRPGRRKRY